MILKHEIPEKARVYIYGAGSAGRALYAWLIKCRLDVSVLGFIDTYKNGRVLGKKLFNFSSFLSSINNDDYDLIIVVSTYQQEISAQLNKNNIHYVVANAPSYLLKEILPEPLIQRIIAKLLMLSSSLFSMIFPERFINKHLFFGEHEGKFIGNNKYYFLRMCEKLYGRIFWVVDDDELYDELNKENIPVLLFSNLLTKFVLFRAHFFYFDNMTWQRKYPWLRYLNAKVIHMSHGVGLKYTEKMMVPNEFLNQLTDKESARLNERIFYNDLLVSTSTFYAREVSSPAYNTPLKNIICSGYPKNDLFYEDISGQHIFTDKVVLDALIAQKERGKKIIVYAPTFRDMHVDFDYTSIIDFKQLTIFLETNNLLLVIKGHTSLVSDKVNSKSDPEYMNKPVIFYRNDRDGYPLLKIADLLITDYSSIYMDFLHSLKPVLFFPYDINEYLKEHRMIQFDYFEMTPGPKAYTQDELMGWMAHFLLQNKDGYQTERRNIAKLAYDHIDSSAWQRIEKSIESLFY